MTQTMRTPATIAFILIPAALLAVLVVSLADISIAQQLFVRSTYYLLMAMVLCWAGTYVHAARNLPRQAVIAWVKENWPGLVVAVTVTVVAWLAVHPALRVLSDEANLVGTSKNFFASKSATFTISGKNYYDSYWDVDVAIDRRPTLFPFLVSLVHTTCGYSHENAFSFNLLVLPLFVLVSYRLAKSLGGETFAVVAALLVVAHPITLVTVRSGSFDFLTAFFAVLILRSLSDYTQQQSPAGLAILWMNLCMFAEIRYETALFILPVVALLCAFRMISGSMLRPYAFVYSLTPAFLLPRIWQAALRGNVPEQDPGSLTFSFDNFRANVYEYFKPILSPLHDYPAHSAPIILLGIFGCLLWLRWLGCSVTGRDRANPRVRFGIFLMAWILLQVVIVFTYVWGRAQYPTSARLVIAIDTFFSFAAAWFLTTVLKRFRPFVSVMIGAALLTCHVPGAAQHRFMNRITQTRENSTTWRFFDSLHEKRILIVSDRPNLFTIMDYGAMDFDTARNDPYLFTAFERHLFLDIYIVQPIRLSTRQPLPGYDLWPTRKLETMLEFQNDADVLIRISRLAHEPPAAMPQTQGTPQNL